VEEMENLRNMLKVGRVHLFIMLLENIGLPAKRNLVVDYRTLLGLVVRKE
jgi:hypothetical protein